MHIACRVYKSRREHNAYWISKSKFINSVFVRFILSAYVQILCLNLEPLWSNNIQEQIQLSALIVLKFGAYNMEIFKFWYGILFQ